MVESVFETISEDNFYDMLEELDRYNGCLGDDRWYSMDDLDELMYNMSATEILREGREIDPDDDYVRCGIWGYESTSEREYDSSYQDIDTYNELLEYFNDSELDYYISDESIGVIHAVQRIRKELHTLGTTVNAELNSVVEEINKELNETIE